MLNNTSKRIKPADLAVHHDERPGWVTGSERIPAAGEEIYCTEGIAEVVKVLGRTGNGSRLLELRLPEAGSKPFFAAASNVLVAPAA